MRPLRSLPFTAPWLLAPMEGVTDPTFRELVLGRNGPEVLGGAFTEFIRVLESPLGVQVISRHLGSREFPQPIGVQLMGSSAEALEGSAAAAKEAGASLVDLNCGCPAKVARRGRGGAALLKEPGTIEVLVRALVRGVAGALPVSAKIRAGWEDASRVEELALAAQAGGAALVSVHCRTVVEQYQPEVDWTRIARVVSALAIPVCGNGGVQAHADLERMRRETGCALVMVGQAAIGDPWIFSGRGVEPREAARFLLDYVEALRAQGATPRSAASRVKQLLRSWRAGELLRDEADRASWLGEADPERQRERLSTLAR